MTLSIAFLSKYLGPGEISEKIKAVIAKVKKPVDTAVGKVTGWIADKLKFIVAKIKDWQSSGRNICSRIKRFLLYPSPSRSSRQKLL